jgi:hypothetical protein
MKEQFGYAVCSDSDVYHLFDVGTSHTLCGLSTLARPEVPRIDLQLLTDIPRHARLCRHCDDAADARTR